MRNLSFIVLLFLGCCISCVNRGKPATNSDVSPDTTTILPLEAGEVYYKNKTPFGEEVNLAGTQLIDEAVIFKPSESELLIKDEILVVKNLGEHPLLQFSLPNGKFVKYGKASYGQGPDEFVYPNIVPAADTSLLCYIFESTNQKLYQYHKSGDVIPYPFSLSPLKKKQFASDKQLVNLNPRDFIYVETSPTGKSIFRTTAAGDSVNVKEVYNLGLDPKMKSGFSYIGDFVVNAKQNRMAYAYKYFKIIKFMDLDAQTVRTINFEKEQFDESSLRIADGLDNNVTHYWGACAGEHYVYFMYSGRSPVALYQEQRRLKDKYNYYIYMEQYDWNGNPVRKYKLDHWGYFTVDEPHNKLYLLSTHDDDPLFVFQLPE
ncbi:MAG: TolB-like 6-bladed beta-propeller domain-containing protein [Tannerella sp.]|jgi:hypothetical protein|nr:TolB-like 6-bladed beta-propeller domain-containing protein [Tannerella sp.]